MARRVVTYDEADDLARELADVIDAAPSDWDKLDIECLQRCLEVWLNKP